MSTCSALFVYDWRVDTLTLVDWRHSFLLVCVCVCVCVCVSVSACRTLWVQLCRTWSQRWRYGNSYTYLLALLHRKLLFCLSVPAVFILLFIAISVCCNSMCLISFTSLDTSCFYVCILRPGGSQKCFVLSLALKGPAESLSRDPLNMLYEPIEDRSSSELCMKIHFISHRKQTPSQLWIPVS